MTSYSRATEVAEKYSSYKEHGTGQAAYLLCSQQGPIGIIAANGACSM